jgi:hypothetical protein
LCGGGRRDQFAAMNLALAALAVFALLPLVPLPPQDPAKKPADAPAKIDPSTLKQLEWLCGTWVLEDGKVTTEEHWRPLQGSTLLGSRFVPRNQLTSREPVAATALGATGDMGDTFVRAHG